MRASELKPGMEIDGWKVTDVWGSATADFWFAGADGDGEHELLPVVLLELERGKGSFDQVLTSNPPQYQRKHETRRTWYRADEEVEVMR